MADRCRTRETVLAALVGLALLCPPAVRGQALNACDLNADGKVDVLDIQLATSMALGSAPCAASVAGAGVCNIVVVQRIVNAAVGGACVTGVVHSAALTWTASTSSNVTGYNVYRGTQPNGPYTRLTAAPVAGTAYTDFTVQAGQTYYYVATAVDSSSNESAYSSQASAVIPTP